MERCEERSGPSLDLQVECCPPTPIHCGAGGVHVMPKNGQTFHIFPCGSQLHVVSGLWRRDQPFIKANIYEVQLVHLPKLSPSLSPSLSLIRTGVVCIISRTRIPERFFFSNALKFLASLQCHVSVGAAGVHIITW